MANARLIQEANLLAGKANDHQNIGDRNLFIQSLNRDTTRLKVLRTTTSLFAIALFAKVLSSIQFEYRFYFPANFDAAFLENRRETFVGIYRSAFYVHIVASPLALAGALILKLTGGLKRVRELHRLIGRFVGVAVLCAVIPSGLIMSTQTLTGAIAGLGFATLALATAASMIFAVMHARNRRFDLHQVWADRCFILLCSPLLLRIISGAAITGGLNIAMCDGSATFISNTIDAGDSSEPTLLPAQWESEPIASPYGVWGALGTAAGEEIVSDW